MQLVDLCEGGKRLPVVMTTQLHTYLSTALNVDYFFSTGNSSLASFFTVVYKGVKVIQVDVSTLCR